MSRSCTFDPPTADKDEYGVKYDVYSISRNYMEAYKQIVASQRKLIY